MVVASPANRGPELKITAPPGWVNVLGDHWSNDRGDSQLIMELRLAGAATVEQAKAVL